MFGWEVEGRPDRRLPPRRARRLLPARRRHATRRSATCTSASTTSRNARPHPDPAGVEPRHLGRDGRALRVWILVGDDDSEDAILDRAEKHGATVLWRHHYWKEFNGFNGAFEDPWGNTVVLWTKGGDDPLIPEGFTRE